MRVLHLLPETASAGAENQARYMLEALPRAGIEPELAFFRRGDSHELFERLDIPTHEIGARRPLLRDLRRRSRELRSLIAATGPEIVHAWLFEAHLVALDALPPGSPAHLVIGQREGAGYPEMARKLRSIGGRAAIRLLRRRIDCVLANSDTGADVFRRLGVPSNRIVVQPNGLDEGRVSGAAQRRDQIRSVLGAGTEDRLVMAVGRSTPEKSHDVLLAAMRRVRATLPESRLVLVGTGAAELEGLTADDEKWAQALGWRSDAPAIIAAGDCVAIASRSEGHSNVADEALMLGVPVVTTNTGGHVSLVRECAGAVVPVGDVDGMASAIVEMLRHPPDPAQAQRAARAALSMDAAAARLADLYRSLVARP